MRSKRTERVGLILFLTALAFITASTAAQASCNEPPCACTPIVCIPESAIIEKATFSIYAWNASLEGVSIHSITSPWNEALVTWNNFAASYDPSIAGFFQVLNYGWQTTDVTQLVERWIDDPASNLGILLDQGTTYATAYISSDYGYTDFGPKLEVCYHTWTNPETTCVTLERPCDEPYGIADATVSKASPDENIGSDYLMTGGESYYQSLISFEVCQLPCTGEIGDFVWNDENENGIQDPGEPGIADVTVQLSSFNGDPPITATTDQNGFYQFSKLCAGDYIVEVVSAPAGYTPSPASAPGSTTENDSNGSPAAVTLAFDNSSDQTVDFGFYIPCTGTIGDFVWNDENENGIQDPGEPGIAGVTVQLSSLNGDPPITTTTDQNGFYQFSKLCAGDYIVEVVSAPAGYTPSPASAPGSTTENDSNGSPAAVTLAFDNSSDQTVDFGFYIPCTGTIGDFVWNDENENGIQDPGEPGIADVTVQLKMAGSDATIQETETDQNGFYQFNKLCAGEFTVVVITPTGYKPSPVSAPGSTPENDSNGSPAVTILESDQSSDYSIDFGFYNPDSPCVGTRTPGYWKNHPGEWPVDTITIGGVTYSKQMAIELMLTGSSQDKTFTMFRSLVAAKLNVFIGNNASCINHVIASADAWMATHGPVGSGVKAGGKKSPWRTGEPLHRLLDEYNNGLLCAPSPC